MTVETYPSVNQVTPHTQTLQQTRTRLFWTTVAAGAGLFVFGMCAAAQSPAAWSVIKPSNTGIPGEEMRFSRWSGDGRLWTAARWPFWGEAGIGVYDPEFDTWQVHTNWETSIPSEFINDLEFDPHGTAWIATGAGLVRFDGSNFTVWNAANSPMQHDTVQNLAVAPNGHVWVNNTSSAAAGDAILEFDGIDSWTRYSVPDQLPWAEPWTDLANVYVADNGHVWVTHDVLDGVAQFDGQQWVHHGSGIGRLDDMAQDGAGNLWLMGHPVGGDDAYFRFNGTTFERFPLPSPQTLSAAPDGTIYAGSWHGRVERVTNGGEPETFLTGLNTVFDITPTPSGDVWVTTIGAVGQFRADGSWVRDLNSYNTGLPDYFIDRFATDRDGYFWVASGEGGLSRFDGSRWRNWGNHNAGAEPYPFAGNEPMGTAFLDSRGRHWFGGNGIARWNSASGQFTGFWNWENNPGMGVSLWTHFAEDAQGTVFSTDRFGATFRFDENTEAWVREPISPYAPNGLPGMESDRQGRVWLAAWFSVHQWDGVAWSELPLPDPDYFFDLGGINAMAIGPDDALWLGTNDGVVVHDGTGFTRWDPTNSPLPFRQVTAIDVRSDGMVGLAAADYGMLQGSAVVIDGAPGDAASWQVYLQSETPIPHWQVEAAGFDPNGDLWIGATSEGTAVLHVGAPPEPALLPADGLQACQSSDWFLTGAAPGSRAVLLLGLTRAERVLRICPDQVLGITPLRVLGSATADAEGKARVSVTVPCALAGKEILVQTLSPLDCAASPVVPAALP